MIKQIIKKADIVLFIIILVFGLAVAFGSLLGASDGDIVVVSVNGETYGEYDINVDREIEIVQNGHTNNITIKGGKVQMTSSTCENQVCVNTGEICMTNDTIVCLPNRVMITIRSSKGGGVDVVSD